MVQSSRLLKTSEVAQRLGVQFRRASSYLEDIIRAGPGSKQYRGQQRRPRVEQQTHVGHAAGERAEAGARQLRLHPPGCRAEPKQPYGKRALRGGLRVD